MKDFNIVQVKGVHKTYNTGRVKVHALRGVDLAIRDAEMMAIMGPSGCGKTTLLNCLSGLDLIDQGEISVKGHIIPKMADKERTKFRAEEMGFVFQDFNLVPTLTALENVMLACAYAGVHGAAAKTAALEVLHLVGLADRAGHRPAELSGGEQQRVAIARALVNRPALVLADEPTGNLDSERSAEVLALLRQSNREHGQTIVLVTHDAEVGQACDRVVWMRDGEVRCQALPG